ncbi:MULTISPECIES: DUF1028 domain-containing protein [Mesobacillus]|uniref:Pilus assembly protein n=2 Tax=Mesobacillus TaxID=2675231 RepID=A0A0D6ZC51_9BACI|nr:MULTISPECIES: DUF1028 domain-containing protein [Mesobacillus]KIY23122.1 pilus assembly protein [Mesobacillus subterraneus]MDQ0415289.1 putative Ntn-hydrolase superfamily protein [Mesobacillus stamsii]
MTFSITARCEETGNFGVAVTTRVPAVGTLCPFVEAGVGGIATQSFVNPYIGINGLKYLKEGLSAEEVKERILKEDPEPAIRQFVIVDNTGKAVAFTGEKCDGWNGQIVGQNYGVAGNMLVGKDTILETARAFENSKGKPLADRLIIALQAGQDAGGDKRGRQSAAVKVVSTEEYPLVDLRVDEHPDPVKELGRVYEVAKKELFPFVEMLPTKANPKGNFNFESSREMGLLQDSK